MIARIIEYSARNRFAVLLFVLAAVAWGWWSLWNIPLDAIPDLSDTQVIIYTEWPGRSPDLVEDQVTYPISSTLLAAPQVQVVRGFSFLGSSFIYVIFEEGTDIYWARSRILEYLQAVRSKLPADANPVLGPDATSLGWGFSYALVDETGRHDLAELRSIQDYNVKLALESVPGVSQVASVGGFVKQYQITIDPARLLAYNIPLTKVLEAVKKSNRDVEGRVLEFSGAEYMVRGRGYIRSLKDIEDIAVGSNSAGTPVFMRDVARVSLGPEMRRGLADLDGRGEVASGIVVVRFGENVLNVLDRVKEKIRDIEPGLPEGVKIVTTYDRSDLIRNSVKTLRDQLIELAVVVSVVCAVFLFHLPSALVAILTLPVAILISFICMYYLNVTSNIMSLGGIAIAIGEMVDSSIVMVENAHKKLEEWESRGSPGNRVEVIIEAAKEVGPSLFYSLLVITVAFLPIFTLQAQAGRLFKPLAYTKTFAILFSSFVAITLTPALMTVFIRGRILPEEKNPVSIVLRRIYEPAVRFALTFRKDRRRGRLHPAGPHRIPLHEAGIGVHAAALRRLAFLHARHGSGTVRLRGRPAAADPGPPSEGDPRGGAGIREGGTGRDGDGPRAPGDVRDGDQPQAGVPVAPGHDGGEAQGRDERGPRDPRRGQCLHHAHQGTHRHAGHGDPDPRGGQGTGARPG